MYGCGGINYTNYNSCPKSHLQSIHPMNSMPHEDLESMYPAVYYHIYPFVKCYCDVMGIKQGINANPTKEQLDKMVDTIHMRIQPEEQSENIENNRPIGYGGNNFLREIITILLIRELIGRRPFYGNYYYPGYYYY